MVVPVLQTPAMSDYAAGRRLSVKVTETLSATTPVLFLTCSLSDLGPWKKLTKRSPEKLLLSGNIKRL